MFAPRGALEVVSVFCLNDQAYDCLIHLRIEQVYWHEHRHCSQLLLGDDWQGSIDTRDGIAVSRLQAVDSLK